MAAGIPGTGIGGLFYFLLVLSMPVREIWRTVTGRSNARQWRAVLFHLTMVIVILAALWGEALLIRQAMTWVDSHLAADSITHRMIHGATLTLTPALAMAPFIVLGSVIVMVHVLRLIVRRPIAQSEAVAAEPEEILQPAN